MACHSNEICARVGRVDLLYKNCMDCVAVVEGARHQDHVRGGSAPAYSMAMKPLKDELWNLCEEPMGQIPRYLCRLAHSGKEAELSAFLVDEEERQRAPVDVDFLREATQESGLVHYGNEFVLAYATGRIRNREILTG